METKRCPNCDYQVASGDQFCVNCGHTLFAAGKTIALGNPQRERLPKKNVQTLLRVAFVLILGGVSFVLGARFSSTAPSPALTAESVAILPEAVASPIPRATSETQSYSELYVKEYPAFTLYTKEEYWPPQNQYDVLQETFSEDQTDYGELLFPYITGNGLLLEGESAAQILADETLMSDGNMLHFRDWEHGLRVQRADKKAIESLSFNYRASEEWKLVVNGEEIPLPPSRPSFVGLLFHADYPSYITLRSDEKAQGGLSIDTIVLSPLQEGVQ